MTPTIGQWFRVTAGPHRNKRGVVDLIEPFAVGVRYRLTSQDGYIGRFAAEQLEACSSPQSEYVSPIAPEVTQATLDMLMGGRR